MQHPKPLKTLSLKWQRQLLYISKYFKRSLSLYWKKEKLVKFIYTFFQVWQGIPFAMLKCDVLIIVIH